MYQRFKDCLLKPRNIADYIKEPKKKTIIYTTILLIVYIIPLILISLLSNTSVTKLSSSISNDLIEAEQINYEIKDGKLVSINNDNTPQVIKSKIILSDAYLVNTLYVFDVSGENYLDSLNVDKGAYLVLLFKEDAFNISTIEVTDTPTNENNNPGITVSNKVNSKKDKSDFSLLSLSYSDLEIENVNFSNNKSNNSINFKNEIATMVSSIYEKIKIRLLPFIILFVIMLGVSSYFFSVVFIALLFKLLYRYLQVDFGTTFKTVILCSTPYVICSVLASVTGFTLLDIVGQCFMIGYATKALTTYKIKYDGGVPLPRYMQDMMNNNNEEKGSDDDEL